MPCTPCETTFQNVSPVVVTVTRTGTDANVHVQNAGRNIAHLRRMLFCYTTGTGAGVIYLRPGSPGWVGAEYLEQGATHLYYTIGGFPAGWTVSAQVEYVEISGRSRSCTETF
ncbi:MAG TPA: hypothetical protein VF142_00450 [Longimicrobium sp.]